MMVDGPHVVDFDHIVLNVRDIEASLAFYCGELGLEPVRVDEWRRGECGFPSARVSESFLIDFGTGVPSANRNLDHFCFVIKETDLKAIADDGRFRALRSPNTNYGAKGVGHSLKILDPDDNIVELRYYP
jgi:catechol 2,3-dioxygenase-like lactoylglutathione lyase family enzyme